MPQTMPFDFLLQYLPGTIIVKPAIGMFYLYYNGKIVLIARRTVKNPQHNGLWIATEREHHESLKRELPAIGDFVFEEGSEVTSHWLLLSDAHDDFESTATRLCEMISNRDPRIGRLTKKNG